MKTILLRSAIGLVLFVICWLYAVAPLALLFDRFYTVRVESLPVRPITTDLAGDYRLAEWWTPIPSSILGIQDFLAEGSDISFTKERSVLIWPTPFEMNFISGRSASWRRYTYYRLISKKPSGGRLELVWRYIQPYYAQDGWINDQIGESTGLIQIEHR